MSDPLEIIWHDRPSLPKVGTYIAFCCREWIAPIGYPGGRCGLCGDSPKYLRPDPECCADCAGGVS